MSANQRQPKNTVRSPRSILRNPLRPTSRAECTSESRLHITPESGNDVNIRPRSVIGLETRRFSLTDSDTSHKESRTRHSVADLRTLIRNGFSINPDDLNRSLYKSGSRIWSSGSVLSGSGGIPDLESGEVEEVDSGVGEDPWCQYKSLIQQKKHLILQEHTSWLNNVLTRRNYQPITDLCRSIRDGVTLIHLVQILTNAQVANVFKKPVQQSDRVENLQNCLHHLELHDVDTQGINGVDLADGNLKSTLILMNNLRKKYENYQAYPPRQTAELIGSRDVSQCQHPTSQMCTQYHQPQSQVSGATKPAIQLSDTPRSSSVQLPSSMQFTANASPSVIKGSSSPHRTTSQSNIAYSPGPSSHRQDTQTPNSTQKYQPHMNLIPGVIMDEAAPARPPLPQEVIRSSSEMTKSMQREGHDLQMSPHALPGSQTNELSNMWAVHCRQPPFRQPTSEACRQPITADYRKDVPLGHRPPVTDGCGLPISDSYRRLGPVVTAQSVSQSVTNPYPAYTGRSTSVTPSALSNAWSKSTQFLEQAVMQQQRTTNQVSLATNPRRNEHERGLPPKLYGHFNAGYEHDGGELIVPPKPQQSQEVMANTNKTAYVPSHPSERPTCVPRLPAQMPNSPSHVSAQQTTPRMSREASSHQPPPVYNPPPQYTRTYIQKQPTGDKGNTMGHGPPDNAVQQTGSTTSLHQVCNNTTYFPNSSRASNQRSGDYIGEHPAHIIPSPVHRNSRPPPQQSSSQAAVSVLSTHRAVPANGRASPQGQSSTPASQSPNHDKMLTLTCSQQNYVNVDHVTSTARYGSQTPAHSCQVDFMKGNLESNIKNTDNAFIDGQIPPSSVYPINGTSMGRAACIDRAEDQLSRGVAWTKVSSPRHGASPRHCQETTVTSSKTLQDDIEALYSVVRKHRQERNGIQNVQNKSDVDKLSANKKQEMVGSKTTSSPIRNLNRAIPPPDADDWNSDDSSLTPPLPPLSPSNSPTPPGSPPKIHSRINRVLEMPAKLAAGHRKSRRSGSSARSYETGWRRSGPGRAAYRTHARTRVPITRTLNDVDSIDRGSTSNLSDGDEWEDVITGNEVHQIRQQMEGLEMMYTEILKMLGLDKEYIPGSRRSISSLSSISRSGTRRTRSNAFSHRTSREMRSMNKRFNRLEAHVVTLARSVAHLSSELHMQDALRAELEEIRKDLKQLKKERHQHQSPEGANIPGTGLMAGLLSAGHADSRRLTEFEKFRGWIPSLTNPKRVKKLAKFFGEDRLLQYFLEKLGYQKYIKNFRAEEITILELPYMSEERLEKLGIPMGPRQRILQEAQMCFRQENFNIYIV